MSTFTWPWQYSFPPFFTQVVLQPNVETRRRQLEAWASLVLKYAEEKKISQLVVLDAQQCELFHNVKLNRKLNLDGITSVLDCLRDKEKLVFERRSLNVSITLAFAWNALSRVIWLDKQRSRCRIYWKSPAEWAELVYDWASRLGFRGTVCTLYEITHGPDSAGECRLKFMKQEQQVNFISLSGRDEGSAAFQNLDDDCLLDALRHLEKCGKAEVIQFENDIGVKFF
ncbi:hypothetical protein M513_06173 [Trichuris suis]|uniref:Vacuolar protein-sorting-associated protein 25 n=1 Tax=Trichuris suis TaxID=68888 RepID=A0A085M6L7_9BILA|nr:hypothetical protein M513_06173 [Trichuris suis]